MKQAVTKSPKARTVQANSNNPGKSTKPPMAKGPMLISPTKAAPSSSGKALMTAGSGAKTVANRPPVTRQPASTQELPKQESSHQSPTLKAPKSAVPPLGLGGNPDKPAGLGQSKGSDKAKGDNKGLSLNGSTTEIMEKLSLASPTQIAQTFPGLGNQL